MVAKNSDATRDVREEKKGKVQRADSGGGERRGVSSDGHTGGRKRSCQTFVREGVKEKGGNSLTCD